MITTKINGVEVNEVPNQTEAKATAQSKEVSIGEVCDAIETIVYASKVMERRHLLKSSLVSFIARMKRLISRC